MLDNENDSEVIGESIPISAENAVAEVDPQYEARVLLSVAESSKSIMKTSKEQAEIVALGNEIKTELGGEAVESVAVISPEEQRKQEHIALSESLEGRKFSFPGISEKYNATLSDERDECQEYFIGTWDELTEKFRTQGMKVHTGKNGEIYILPGDSTDVENDGIMPRHLEINDDMDEGLKLLIQQNRK
ncbi:MAG: hypothetical protein UY04_C0019G0002 [Parcubacteria group bacterium GW2011_GWA2_47_7]|nr:MAG: hypothetical protein UY04_C0019G0002 [Parcubacteria group bacterium GW2011_GWA2_47_7]